MPWYKNRNGEQLWYEDEGAGCPVLLLHGWCMSTAVWKYQFEGLAASFRLIAPDLRGHGRSRETSGSLSFDSFANDLFDLFEYLNLSQVVIVGWSMGAQIAIQSCAELSGRLAGMVLVSATPRFIAADDFPHGLTCKEAEGMRLKVQRNTRRALDGFYTRLFAEGELGKDPSEFEVNQLLSTMPTPDTAAVLDALDGLVGTDMRTLLAPIAIPVLIVNGALDQICLPGASSYLRVHIRGARQVMFPHSGHAPFLSHYQQFNDEISGFARRECEHNA